MSEQVTLRINVRKRTADQLDADTSGSSPYSKAGLIGQIIDWYYEQPDTVKTLIRGGISPQDKRDVAKIVLSRMIEEEPDTAGQINPEPQQPRRYAAKEEKPRYSKGQAIKKYK